MTFINAKAQIKSDKSMQWFSINWLECSWGFSFPSLKAVLKQHLLAASSSALRLCGKSDWTTSFERLHIIHERATPTQVMKYKHCLELYRLYNSEVMSDDWINLNMQQNFNDRSDKVKIVDKSRIKVGKNLLVKRLTVINNESMSRTFL